MINKVYLEGVVTSSHEPAAPSKGFFVTIKQKRRIGSYELVDFFSLYGNDEMGNELRAVAKEGAVISIEGVLKTYRAKDGTYKTTIEVTRLIK